MATGSVQKTSATELRAERSNMREQHHELVSERKSERRWKTFFQLALIGIPLLGTIAYVIFFTSAMGFQVHRVPDLGSFFNEQRYKANRRRNKLRALLEQDEIKRQPSKELVRTTVRTAAPAAKPSTRRAAGGPLVRG